MGTIRVGLTFKPRTPEDGILVFGDEYIIEVRRADGVGLSEVEAKTAIKSFIGDWPAKPKQKRPNSRRRLLDKEMPGSFRPIDAIADFNAEHGCRMTVRDVNQAYKHLEINDHGAWRGETIHTTYSLPSVLCYLEAELRHRQGVGPAVTAIPMDEHQSAHSPS